MKNKETKVYKEVSIPHLGHTVLFMDMSQLRGIEPKGFGFTCQFEDNNICVFIQDIEQSARTPETYCMFAHEVVHVLQILCEKYSMRFENEVEHMAYLMHYILQEVLSPPKT